MWCRRFSCRRIASRRVKVPTTLDSRKGQGESRLLSLCDSAAKCTTTSWSATSRSTSGASATEPSTSSTEPSPPRSARTGASERRLAAYVIESMTVRPQSGRTSRARRTKFDPMKPAPPVTSTRMRPRVTKRGRLHGHQPFSRARYAAGVKISVIGCGYLGAVHAACMADFGHHVVGVDIDEAKVAKLAAGVPSFHEPGLEPLLRQGVADGSLRFTTDKTALAHAR